MTLGVVIVTWNSAGHIEACLGSCLRAVAPLGGRVVVIDNQSSDDTAARAARFPSVRVVANKDNAGFAAAVNQGFRELAGCEAVLVLNPDAAIQGGLDPMLRALEDPGVGAVGGLLIDGDGRPQNGFCVRRFPTPASLAFESLGLNRLWPGNPVNRRYRCRDLDLRRPAAVEQPAGAFLLVRRAAWLHVGGFDERYRPLWFEDVDFLKRLREAGFGVLYEPGARAVHAGGHSLASLAWPDRQLYWCGNLLKYAARHFNRPGRWMVCGAVILGSAPRAVTGTLQRRSIRPLGVYCQVLRLTAGCLLTGAKNSGSDPVGVRCAGGMQSET